MVAEHDLDLAQIAGTGREGRVTKKDVLAFLESQEPIADIPAWEQPIEGADLFQTYGELRCGLRKRDRLSVNISQNRTPLCRIQAPGS